MDSKILSLGGIQPHQEAALLIRLKDTLEGMKTKVAFFAEKLAAIGDENDALKLENEKLKKENEELTIQLKAYSQLKDADADN